jgi:hypothetical protein
VTREQAGDRGGHHAGLAEAGQDLRDVVAEGVGGPDDQDAALGQLRVVIQQVGGAMQDDRGLAGRASRRA